MSSFRGLSALLDGKRRLAFYAAPVAFVFGLAFGFLGRIGGFSSDELAKLLFGLALILAAAAPLVAGGGVTFSGMQAGTRSRREELLALPIGRLAIPASILIGGALLLAVMLGAITLGAVPALGLSSTLEAWTRELDQGELSLAPRAAMLAGTFVACFFLAALGSHPVAAAITWSVVPLLIALFAETMGYTKPSLISFTTVAGFSLGAYFLVLPFVLYQGPAHRWSFVRRDIFDPDGIALMSSMVAVAVFGLFGAGRCLVVVLALIALVLWRIWRKRPAIERRSMPLTRLAFALGLVAIAPPLVQGAVADARRLADAADPRGKKVDVYTVSPDGRWLAALISPKEDRDRKVTRVVVADLDGKLPALVLPSRCALIDRSSWSVDGRYLAVKDVGIGRIRFKEAEIAGSSTEGIFAASCLSEAFISTVVLDTKTGDVTTLPETILAPGWSSPAELVHVSATLDGRRVLSCANGHRATVRDAFHVEAYDAASAILSVSSLERLRFDATGVAPTAGLNWRTIDRHENQGSPAEEPVYTFTLARGDERRDVDACSIVWIGGTALLAREPEGLVRISLPELERRLLVPVRSLRTLLRSTFDRLERATFVIRRAREDALVLAMPEGTLAPLSSSEGFAPEIAVGDRVVGRSPGGELLVRDGAGAPRPVF